MTILLLSSSPSASSRSTRLLHHVGEKLAVLGHSYSKLHVADLPPQALLYADADDAEVKAALDKVEQADAVIISTPVYKAAYSGVLKVFLDLLPQDGLAGKLVLPLATGGSQSHMLALDYALRPVLGAISARHVLQSIYATEAQVTWTEEHGLNLDPDIARRISIAADQLSGNLRELHAARALSFNLASFSQMRCSA